MREAEVQDWRKAEMVGLRKIEGIAGVEVLRARGRAIRRKDVVEGLERCQWVRKAAIATAEWWTLALRAPLEAVRTV